MTTLRRGLVAEPIEAARAEAAAVDSGADRPTSPGRGGGGAGRGFHDHPFLEHLSAHHGSMTKWWNLMEMDHAKSRPTFVALPGADHGTAPADRSERRSAAARQEKGQLTDIGLNVLIPEERIAPRVAALAERISADYAGADELVVIGVLKGAFIFLADLTRQLTVPHRVDFIAVSSYADGHQRSGEVRMVLDLRESIEKRHVLVVEDIVDTGRTLRYLVQQFEARAPASVRTCALTRKKARNEGEVQIDYLGFDIPDRWVVGYGLDYAERHRTLPCIAVLDPATLGAHGREPD